MSILVCGIFFFFFFNDTATTEIYTLSLHDALPIYRRPVLRPRQLQPAHRPPRRPDRKSTRLNSSHQKISYAVFCLKKKKKEADSEWHGRWDAEASRIIC